MTKVPFSPPEITEEDILAVSDVLRSGWITTGAQAKQFERELSDWMSGARVAVLNSATAGMEITLRLLGIGAGDEVITSVYTYAATVNVIRHVGATPILVDIAHDGYNLDITAVDRAITPKTKAIIAVDIGGYPCDYDALYRVIEAHRASFSGLPKSRLFNHADRITLIADAAHSLGAQYYGRKSGSLADFSAFSFHAVKNLTTAEGGALSFHSLFGVDAETIYREVMLWSLHGQNKDALAKAQGNGWEYDILFSGYKCNMPDIMAALGRSQLGRYAQTLSRRKTLYQSYRQMLPSPISLPAWDEADEYQSSYHLALVCLPIKDIQERNRIITQMAEAGIVCNVHFKPLHLMTAFNDLGRDNDFLQAMQRYQQVMSLPLFNTMSEEQLSYVGENLAQIVKNLR
ncbi:DegT/DnrJ/EryC1/StrS aminotransferase family protein [Spirochaetales bacterium BR151]|uniref:DegT/DnrJ/EryC1/StrS aminotransferase family protein n=2 Tax=Entomospira culicis TaxID=2719989 RepID=A0A968KU21_9SPIO|nr:DegT/DnrJ/EryC1/StrS aminotransferase family protein [Entomospira culicis]NIZ18504.1 DegT/DnrJ/EryC1/StrS aminotransferase family protein [Entomospira culicis]NIZ68720.1 DegT/DnrJ/EryC1/StrS aminotransferase family protein [Entomospira culicis]